jgi:hypothetical protein
MLADIWLSYRHWLSIGIAFLVGGGILFPLLFLMNKEGDAGGKVRWFFD